MTPDKLLESLAGKTIARVDYSVSSFNDVEKVEIYCTDGSCIVIEVDNDYFLNYYLNITGNQ